MLALAIPFVGAVFFELVWAIHNLPSFSTIKNQYSALGQVVYDRNNQILYEDPLPRGPRRLGWVSLYELSPDIRSLLDDHLQEITNSFRHEAWIPRIARQLKWSGVEIREEAINRAFYRANLQGLRAASYGLFDKSPAQLSLAEGAILFAATQRPELPLPEERIKACVWLSQAERALDCDEMSEKHLSALELNYQIRPFLQIAPQVGRLLKELHQSELNSTLDRELQWQAIKLMQDNGFNGGVVAISVETGETLIYASSDSKSDLVLQPLPCGSLLQPFVFALGLDERVITPGTKLGSNQSSAVAADRALKDSNAMAMLQVLEYVGFDNFLRTMKQLNLRTARPPQEYGPSLTLGGAELNLFDITNAYRMFVRGGRWSPARLSLRQTNAEPAQEVVSMGASYLTATIIGREGEGGWWAQRSTMDAGHNWCVGVNEQIALGVRTDNEPGADEKVHLTCQVWQALIEKLSGREKVSTRLPPVDVVEAEAGRMYLRGTEPTAGESGKESRISFPLPESTLHLIDGHQRYFIQVIAPKDDQNLYLNGRRIARAAARISWEPELGRHTLELRDSRGQVLHQIQFQVVDSSSVRSR